MVVVEMAFMCQESLNHREFCSLHFIHSFFADLTSYFVFVRCMLQTARA